MRFPGFLLEEYMEEWEFKAPHLLCTSDAESITMTELLALADRDGRRRWETLTLGYTETAGAPWLREDIAQLYTGFDGDDVVVFAGAAEGIYAAMTTLLEKGDHVVAITPCYQSLVTLPEMIGAEVTTVALDPNRQWQFDIEAFESALRQNTKLIVLNFPHNPTGAVLDEGTQKKIVRMATERGAWVLCDEVYRSLEPDLAPPMAVAYEKGISLNVMSKAFGLAGLRIGWLACRDREFLERTRKTKHYLSICNSAPSEVLAAIALRARDRILQRNRALSRQNLKLVELFFQEHQARFRWLAPQGGCTAFPEWRGEGTVENLCTKLREKTGVLLLPGSVYAWPGGFFRLGFGKKTTAEALSRFDEFLKRSDTPLIK